MVPSQLQDVVAHWHKLIENLQTTSIGFYEAVEEALERRMVPGLKSSHVKWSEGGLLAPDREYLRIRGDRHTFDICAAPFGTGFFFSSWVTRPGATWVLLHYVLFLIETVAVWKGLNWLVELAWRLGGSMWTEVLRSVSPFVLWPVSVLAVLWLVGLMARGGRYEPERAMLTVPLLGWVYQQVFAPETYYRIDTMLMFQSAVHTAMLEVIDGLTAQKGLRGLTDDERKPTFHKLM